MKKFHSLAETSFMKDLFIGITAFFLVASICMPDRSDMLSGLLRIFASPGKSATSYFAVGGFTATMICLILVPKLEWFAKTKEERSHHKQQKKLHKARQS